MKLDRILPLALAACVLASCVENSGSGSTGQGGPGAGGGGGGGNGGGVGPLTSCPALDALDLGPNASSIVDLDPAVVSPILTDVFDRYAAVEAPGGRRVHVLAQAGVSDPKIRRTREILRMQLRDLPGTSAGAAKADVADAIAGTCGAVAIFSNPSQYDLSDAAVERFDADFGSAYVPLFGDRVVVEGSPGYLAPSPANDETFGAAAVLVFRHGLVTERPAWAAQLIAARENAVDDQTFQPMGPEPYRTLDERYLAIVMDAHSGVWAHDPSGDGSAQNGLYAFGSRPSMVASDASTVALLEDFFPARHQFAAAVEPGFSGTFDMLPNPARPYSNRAQYLAAVQLTGNNQSELFGTSEDDLLVGNFGNNNLKGRGGDDFIDGEEGLDAAVFDAPRAEFTILFNGDGSVNVRHDVVPGLGNDRVESCEVLVFSDQNVQL
ncbi:MAG: hypothetical protein AAFP86_06415 [Planctomycetota bacterium]